MPLPQWLGLCILYLFYTGVGVWGNRSPVFWGWPIVNFVFWVGIGHAGTLISAILFLFRQEWRTSINRAAEAMTIFAVVCAATFPGIHVGRAWLAFWLAPYPSLNLWMWPQFRSPLLWDVFAVSTYGTVSLLFWYMGMVPDLATFRDRSKNKYRRMAYGLLSLGWSGSSRHWMRYEKAYAILAALAAPLVLSVHTIVSFDFAVSQVPGWHTTIFPPYFVAGAIFSGFAMVLTLDGARPNDVGAGKADHDSALGQHVQDHPGDRIDCRTGVFDGVLHRLVRPSTGGKICLHQPGLRSLLVGLLDMVTCNVISPQLFWIKKCPDDSMDHRADFDFREHRHVVRAVRDRLYQSVTRLFAQCVGLLQANLGRLVDVDRIVRLVLHAVLVVLRLMPVINMAETKSTLAKQYHMAHNDEH